MTSNGNEQEPKVYTDLAEAEQAMAQGEVVRIAMERWEIAPWVLRKAQELQDRESLEIWKKELFS